MTTNNTNIMNITFYNTIKNYLTTNKKLFLWLAIPLVIIAVILIAIKYYYKPNDEGLLINIAANLIGIIITVLFVNFIIQQNEKHNWDIAEKRIAHKLQHLVNETNALLNFSFSLPPFLKWDYYIDENGNNLFITYAEKELLPQIDTLIANIDATTLDRFIYYLKKIDTSVNKIYNECSDKLSPSLFANISDLKDLLFHLIDEHRFHTKAHFIDTEKFMQLYRSGDRIHNESVMTFIKENTKTLIRIMIEIDKYLRQNYKNIEEKFPYMIEYRKKAQSATQTDGMS